MGSLTNDAKNCITLSNKLIDLLAPIVAGGYANGEIRKFEIRNIFLKFSTNPVDDWLVFQRKT